MDSPDISVGNCSSTQDTLMPDSETDQFCSYLHAQSKEKLTENLPTKLLAINDEVENQVVATVSDQGSPHHSPSCAQKMPDSETDSYLNTQSKEKLTENLPTKLLAINDEVQNQVVATVSDQGSPHHSPSCAQKFGSDKSVSMVREMTQTIGSGIKQLAKAMETSQRTEPAANEETQMKNSNKSADKCPSCEIYFVQNMNLIQGLKVLKKKCDHSWSTVVRQGNKLVLEQEKSRSAQNELQDELTTCRQNLHDERQQNAAMQEQLNSIVEKRLEVEQKLRKKMRDIQVENSALTARKASVEEENEQQQAQLATQSAQLDAARAQINELRQTNEQQQAQLAIQSAQVDTGTTQINELRQTNEQQQAQLATQSAQLETGRTQINELRQTNEQQQTQLATQAAQVDTGRTQINELRQTNEQQQAQLATQSAQLDTGTTQINEFRQTNEQQQAQLDTQHVLHNELRQIIDGLRPPQLPPERPPERPPDERPPDERPPDERPPDERPPDERPPDERPPDERPPDERPPEPVDILAL